MSASKTAHLPESMLRKADFHVDTFTPTEQLILEVLGARYRLGEPIWPFENRTIQAGESLSRRGFVRMLNGNIERTYRLSLTEEGLLRAVSGTYETPAQRRVRELEAEREVLWARTLELQQQLVLKGLGCQPLKTLPDLQK